MADQVSFYDKLKAETETAARAADAAPKTRAAAQFATDFELGADRGTLVGASQSAAKQLAADAPGSREEYMARSEADRVSRYLSDINERLESPDARADSSYRARLIDARNALANAAKRNDFGAARSEAPGTHMSDVPWKLADAEVGRENKKPYGPSRRRLDRGARGASDLAASKRRLRAAVAAFDSIDTRNPTPATDKALSEAMEEIVRADHEHQRLLTEFLQNYRSNRQAGGQVDIYEAIKDAARANKRAAVSAGKKLMSSPAAKKGLLMAAGFLGSKAATAATSGAAGLATDVGLGGPMAFLEGYRRSQAPYEQVKYVAEEQGTLNRLQPHSLDTLTYDDVVRLRQEGLISPEALQQFRQHTIDTLGFDPQEIY